MKEAMSEHGRLSCIHSIIGADYSPYQNPLRELLEYRKLACIKYMEGNENEEEALSFAEKEVRGVFKITKIYDEK